MFGSEKELVDDFLLSLKGATSPWGELKIGCEFDYQRGRTDVVAVSSTGEVIAFEAKLTKWRNALQQAYRNKCFADLSYVVLPKSVARLAYGHLGEFVRRDVGLCSVEDDELVIMHDALPTQPIQPWLQHKASLYAANGEGFL